ncbi:MAG: DUF512 domain-containing protein [Desulfotomaculum sp.]|nr:DUF512 domain-containing protein [Desulfotomaculum sp.]
MEGKPNSNKSYIESLLFYSAAQSNILPITSACNVRCIFCSHHQNPPEVESYRIPPLGMDQVRQAVEFLDESKPVVIGESTTRIMEGEPLTHPRCMEILREIRRKLPNTPIQLTTNGTLINRSAAEEFTALSPFSINLSLNSSSCWGRKKIMNDRLAEQAIKSAELLKEYHIPFHGSIVAMPHITGWQDLVDTIFYLEQCSAKTVRVFLPGYTKYAPPELCFNRKLWEQLRGCVEDLRRKVSLPITVEPERLENLKAEVLGVIAGTTAQRDGIKPGDVILSVSGREVLSRVHAFNMVLEAEKPVLEVKRGEEIITIKINKKAWETSGLVMSYDINPGTIQKFEMAARRCRGSNILVLCSELAYPVLKTAVEKLYTGNSSIYLQAVKSVFFGGNIMAAGLLTVEDFNAVVEKKFPDKSKYQLILLPSAAFDMRGRDLTGKSYLELQEKWGIPVDII